MEHSHSADLKYFRHSWPMPQPEYPRMPAQHCLENFVIDCNQSTQRHFSMVSRVSGSQAATQSETRTYLQTSNCDAFRLRSSHGGIATSGSRMTTTVSWRTRNCNVLASPPRPVPGASADIASRRTVNSNRCSRVAACRRLAKLAVYPTTTNINRFRFPVLPTTTVPTCSPIPTLGDANRFHNRAQ